MIKPKKILAISIKICIGLISFYIIYKRLSQIPHLKEQCLVWMSEPQLYLVLLLVLLLMPVNWGIESFKWQSVTAQIEKVSYKTAVKSIFSGIFMGNIAPGRAMEFLAKIVFFKIENRPGITVLHFISGMFQMLITVLVGVSALSYKYSRAHQSSLFIYGIIAAGVLLILFFCWAILHVSYIQEKLKFIPWFRRMEQEHPIRFSKTLVARLIFLSMIRYVVFTSQFYVIYSSMVPGAAFFETFTGIAAYFMLTSLIPMISFIEPAIRGAIAIYAFNNGDDHTVTVVLASTFVWVINVVVPSIIGYIIIFREKIVFKKISVS